MRPAALSVIGNPPPQLARALDVIGDHLHPSFDLRSTIIPGKSKESCVLCALTVRDFLRQIGFRDARVKPVTVVMWAEEAGKTLHSLAIGSPTDPRPLTSAERWTGHLITTIDNYLIDPTLYAAARPQWPDMPGMMAVPIEPIRDARPVPPFNLMPIAGTEITDSDRPDYRFATLWLANPKNRAWRRGPDARDTLRRWPVIKHMVEQYNELREAA